VTRIELAEIVMQHRKPSNNGHFLYGSDRSSQRRSSGTTFYAFCTLFLARLLLVVAANPVALTV
jgi:hypothetical protein